MARTAPLLRILITLAVLLMIFNWTGEKTAHALIEGDYRYADNGDGTATITDYLGADNQINIPDTLGGLTVTKIGDSAFSNKSLTDVDIPDSVTEIGSYAFSRNQLEHVVIPHRVTTIKDGAFFTNRIEEIIIPDSVTNIGDYVFSVNKITQFQLPAHMTEIPDGMFDRNQFENLVIPEGIVSIGKSAFESNPMTSITFPDSLLHIDKNAFAYNGLLKSVTIPRHVQSIGDAAFRSTSPLAGMGLTEVRIYSRSAVLGTNLFYSPAVDPHDLSIYGHFDSTVKDYADVHGNTFIPFEYTVQFDSNGGSQVDTIEDIVFNAPIAEPSKPIRAEHHFAGWFKDSGLTEAWVFATDTVKDWITLYAKWIPYPPEAPILTSAVAGNASVTLDWETVPGATHYHVYQREEADPYDAPIVSVTDAVYEVRGLTNGTTYYYVVTAVNAGGESGYSNELQAVLRAVRSIPHNPDPLDDATEQESYVDVLVNGQVVNAGTAVIEQVDERQVATIKLDRQRLEQRLAEEGEGAVITIPWPDASDVVVGTLNGQMVKDMERQAAVVEVMTEQAAYTLPAMLINIDAVSGQLGRDIALQDIDVQIEIAPLSAKQAETAALAAEDGSFAIVAPPIAFTIRAVHGDQTIEVTQFTAYVKRTIAIPEGAGADKITTGIIVEPDGTVRHVPTKIVIIDGKYYATINSLTNSSYTVIWNPLAFEDVDSHWAQEAVNNMGSRLVVSGTGNLMYEPDRDVTRAEFAAIVTRALGLGTSSKGSIFKDVRQSDWHAGAIQAAHDWGLIHGFEDGTFRPDERVTREQAMLMVSKAMTITELQGNNDDQSADETLLAFADADSVSHWAKDGIADSVSAGIISGRGSGLLAPKSFVTRAEAAVMMQLLLQKSELINR